ncbi:MAG: glycogen debranching enzyme GlgX, partial [Pseudomonadota bacterium]
MPLPRLPITRRLPLPAGRPWPLGTSWQPGGLNLAVWAPDATRLQCCLFDAAGRRELLQLDLPRCSDGVWHGLLPFELLDALAPAERELLPAGLAIVPGLIYGLRAHGSWDPAQGQRFNADKLLLDPWAQAVVGDYGRASQSDELPDLSLYLGHDPADPEQPDPRDSGPLALKARVLAADALPRLALPAGPLVEPSQRVIGEIHVKGATMRHPEVPTELRGSYAGLAHPVMLDYWKRLGLTTLNLLPIHSRADEERLQRLGLRNYWGYSSIGWLAPEPRYWSGRPGTTPEGECRTMIEAMHAAGFEVVLDVVYNHSAETDELGPTLSLRGLANARYYRLDPAERSRYLNWAGCGNVLDLSEPRVVELVLGSLRHWVEHYGVDGFRFDLAPILGRDRHGDYTRSAPFFAALQADPVLSRVLLIAEPWDMGPGGYQLGGFPPGWLEWNDRYRDTMRAWWLRGGADRGEFVHRWAGSSGQFDHDQRAPLAGVNFISAHDGFTLRDLDSYNQRHNEANGEHNRDGHHDNLSCNCGVEGPSSDPQVLQQRRRLSRALLATLLLGQGTPMLLAGDEIGHSQQGNNNAYCQDNELTWLDWAGADTDLQECVTLLLALRRALPMLRIGHWLGRADVVWRDAEGHELHGA